MTITLKRHDLLAAYPVVIEIPVLWGELDAYGHVNNTVYFRYFESARMTYLERCGILQSYERDRTGIILYSTECRFRSALHHPDTVLVGACTVQIEDDRFVMGYGAASVDQGRVVAEGRATLVWFDYKTRVKISLPSEVREAIQSLEQQNIDSA